MPAPSREKMVHEKRLEDKLVDMPPFVVEYIRTKKRIKYSSSTLLGYVHEFIKFFKWLQEEDLSGVENIRQISLETLEKLSKENAELYKEYLEEEVIEEREGVIKKRSNDAVLRNINALKSLFKYLTQETENEDGECYFYRNVFSKIKVNKEKITANRRAKNISSIILAENEIDEFLHFVKFDYEKLLNKRQKATFMRDKERDLAIFSMLLGSGARVSEISNMLVDDINFKKEQIDIIRKGNKEDTILVLPSALEALKDYLQVRTDRYKPTNNVPYVFVTKYKGTAQPISVRAIQNLVEKYTRAFNSQGDFFASGKGLSPHKFRHTFASEWVRTGGNLVLLRDQLGQNSIETTAIYTNLSIEESKKIIDEMERLRK